MSKEKIHKTSIGGQAVIEGVMMRGPKEMAVAVRKSDGEIVLDKKPLDTKMRKLNFLKWPIIRGIVGFVDSLVLGTKTLMYSAELYDVEGEEAEAYEPTKFDLFLEKLFKNKNAYIYASVVIALILGVAMFVVLPAIITNYVTVYVQNGVVRSLIEGGVRMAIFLAYVSLTAMNKDIKRVFQYHGAEHKSIACYEHGQELTVENVRNHSRFHPRCGTSFLIEVMIISVLVFSVVSWDSLATRILIKVALFPLVAGLAYEFIKFAGRSDSKIIAALNQPGMWLQRITTNEPDDDQIEVAIHSLNAVIPENKEEDKW